MQSLPRIGQIISISLVLLSNTGLAQLALYDNPKAVDLVKVATNHIYSWEFDSAEQAINDVRGELGNHPVVPLLEGLTLLWSNIPVLDDSTFAIFSDRLLLSSKWADSMPSKDSEAVYFEMAAKGLLAEYLADRGQYMKAFGQAKSAYYLLKSGFDLSEEVPDFLFAIGLYNYFIEVYPEKNPVYKPLVWFFKSGDPELGLEQLDEAYKSAVLVDVESAIYLGYIYLRYEETPVLAQIYLEDLVSRFPNNLYLISKLLESYNQRDFYDKIQDDLTQKLLNSEKPYFQLVGATFNGIKAHYVFQKPILAQKYYQLAIEKGLEIPDNGEYYKGYAYFGLGEIFNELGERENAKKNYNKALQYAESSELKKKVKASF